MCLTGHSGDSTVALGATVRKRLYSTPDGPVCEVYWKKLEAEERMDPANKSRQHHVLEARGPWRGPDFSLPWGNGSAHSLKEAKIICQKAWGWGGVYVK